jgi:uncharacterized protein (TIGR02757 family)
VHQDRKHGSSLDAIATALEDLYRTYNKREFVHPDPLEFLYDYDEPLDREIVALVASSLAYGRVAQILKSVEWVLSRMPQPREFLMSSTPSSLRKALRGFKHRFTTGDEMASMLSSARRAIERFGSLEKCFMSGIGAEDESLIPGLTAFVETLKSEMTDSCGSLLPDPAHGSACKRLNLFLRWMVRQDDVDPGGWYNLSPAGLVVPLDVHMHRIALALGLTGRKQADMRTAIEITDAFRMISPADPVRYDFALTRLGIRDDCDPEGFFGRCGVTIDG